MAAGHDKIEWADDASEIAHRLPAQGALELRLGDQLFVRENQAAVVFRDGRGLDVFGPGRHTFASLNLPVLTRLLRLPAGYRSAIRAAIYFVSMRPIAGVAWGGTVPFEAADPRLGRVRIRASGTVRVRVVQPLLFLNQVVALRGVDGDEAIRAELGETVARALRALVEEGGIGQVPDAAADVAAGLKARASDATLRLGVELQDLAVSVLELPDGARAGASRAGAASPSPWTAARPRTTGEAGFGSPFGHGFGLMTPGLVLERFRRGDDRPEGIHERRVVGCPACHAEVALTSRFCQQCGHQMVLINRCPACSTDLPAEARFCFLCGTGLSQA